MRKYMILVELMIGRESQLESNLLDVRKDGSYNEKTRALAYAKARFRIGEGKMKNFFDIFNDDNIIKASECYAFSQQQSLIYGVAGTQKSLIIAKGYNLAQKATALLFLRPLPT